MLVDEITCFDMKWTIKPKGALNLATYAVKLERSAPLVIPRHPHAPDDDKFEEWCRAEKSAEHPLAVDLFSGAGGLGAGVEAAGWTVAVAVDRDKPALETHRANFRGQALEVDMADAAQVDALIERIRPLEVDLVVGGPPCQPFSRAGRAKIQNLVNYGLRSEIDSRKELWRSFINVVLAVKPRAVLMENVPDMAIGDDLLIIRKIGSLLEGAGYLVDYRLLDAWRYGVPQHRKRFILQARNDGLLPTWPTPAKTRPTVRDAIEDLPPLNNTTGARELKYVGHPVSVLAKGLRDEGSDIIYDHMTRPVRDDDREAFKLMTSATLYSDLPDHLRRYRSDTFNDKYKRLAWDDLSRTITAHIAKDGYWYIHPAEHRTLTVREAARIQTFPDNFRFAGTRSDAFRQIGNAVPPALGKAVAKTIFPSDKPSEVIARLPIIRQKISMWARIQRKQEWWCYPGPDMTDTAAIVAALLEVHRLPISTAEFLMEPLRGACELSIEVLQHINVHTLSSTRKKKIRHLRETIRSNPSSARIMQASFMLGDSQRRIYSSLCGGEDLFVNKHVGKIVSMLMELPESNTGLGTDIKVALAQLVSTGEEAALRMCAIRNISISELQAKIVEPTLYTTEHTGE